VQTEKCTAGNNLKIISIAQNTATILLKNEECTKEEQIISRQTDKTCEAESEWVEITILTCFLHEQITI